MLQFFICVTILPIILGLGFIQLKKEKGTGSLTECYVLGLLFLFLLGEAASCIAIKTERGFSFYCAVFAGSVGVAAVLSLLVGRKMPRILWKNIADGLGKEKEEGKKLLNCAWKIAVFVLLLGLPVAGLFLYVPDAGSSTMVETISVTSSTDTVFGYNPVTGQALEYGMYPIYKLACLPLIYSTLYMVCGLSMEAFAYYAIPVWVLFLFAAVLFLAGETFFDGNKEKKQMFLVLVGMMLITGDGEKNTLAYGLLHGGFRGETMAAAVVIPFGAYMIYRFFVKKDRLYGAVGTLLALSGILVTRPLFLPDSFAFVAEDTGREWMLLAIAIFALYLARERTKKKWKKQEVIWLGCCLFLGVITGGVFSMAGVAYAGACLYGVAEERKKALPFIIGVLLMICMAGTVLPLRGACVKNADVPQGDVEIQDRISELAQSYEQEVVLVAPENVMEKARLQNDRIVLPYGKNLWRENCNREIADVYTDKELLLFEQMKTDYMQPDTIAAMAAEMHCNILVMRECMSEEMLIRGGWKEAEEVTGYAVYYK